MPETPGPTLTLRSVSYAYPAHNGLGSDVLSQVSFEVQPGSFVAVAGRSGSGKTTLLSVATGLARPQEGEVLWGTRSLAHLDGDELADWRRDNVGIVLQGGGLIDSLTAEENVGLAVFGDGRRHDRSRIRDLLDQLGLGGKERQLPAELSAGQRTRVAVARALYASPSLLVADEPTANLDRRTADRLLELLVEPSLAGQSRLVATHDPNVIARADQVVELE